MSTARFSFALFNDRLLALATPSNPSSWRHPQKKNPRRGLTRYADYSSDPSLPITSEGRYQAHGQRKISAQDSMFFAHIDYSFRVVDAWLASDSVLGFRCCAVICVLGDGTRGRDNLVRAAVFLIFLPVRSARLHQWQGIRYGITDDGHGLRGLQSGTA